MSGIGIQCVVCIHGRDRDGILPTRCTAFPEGIPVALLSGEVSHLAPYPGDHGIVFEGRTKADHRDVEAAYADVADGEGPPPPP